MPPVLIDLETGQEEEDLIDLEEVAATDRQPDYLGAAWEGVSDLWNGPAQLYSSANEAVQKHPTLSKLGTPGATMAIGYEGGKYLYENPEAILPTAAGLGSAAIGMLGTPLAGALSAPTGQYLASRGNEWLGLTEPQSKEAQAEQLIRDMTGSAVGYGIPKGVSQGTKGVRAIVNHFDNTPTTQKNIWEGAQRPGSTASAMDAGRGQPGRELQIVEDIKPYEAKFREMAPYAGIDDVPGQSAVQRMRDNLGGQKESALSLKQQVLDLVDQRGPGISLDEIDLSSLDKYGPGTFTEGAPYVKNTLTSAFTKGPSSEWERAMGVSSPKTLSANQVQGVIREIDKEITKLGGYDDVLNAQAQFDPSKIAPQAEHLGALRQARKQLNNALNSYSGRVLGIENPLTEVNARASTAIEYEPLMERWQNTVNQSLTPGSARSMTGPQSQQASAAFNGPLGYGMNELSGGWMENRALQQKIAKGLGADYESVNKLQQYGQQYGQPMGPVQRGTGFKQFNAVAEPFQGIMDALAPILPGMMSLDPMTGQIHDPNERRVGITAIQNSPNVSLVQQAQAISQLNAGKLPQGIEQAPQTQELPDIGSAYGAAERAMGGEMDLEDYSQVPGSEDELAMQMMDEVDYDRSGY